MRTLNLICIALILTLTSCARSCQKFDRSFQVSEKNYEIIMYSGGKVIFHDKFRGIVNNSEHSDGCYYSKGDSIIEVSGDYVIKYY